MTKYSGLLLLAALAGAFAYFSMQLLRAMVDVAVFLMVVCQ